MAAHVVVARDGAGHVAAEARADGHGDEVDEPRARDLEEGDAGRDSGRREDGLGRRCRPGGLGRLERDRVTADGDGEEDAAAARLRADEPERQRLARDVAGGGGSEARGRRLPVGAREARHGVAARARDHDGLAVAEALLVEHRVARDEDVIAPRDAACPAPAEAGEARGVEAEALREARLRGALDRLAEACAGAGGCGGAVPS